MGTGRVTVSGPRDLIAAVDRECAARGIGRSQFTEEAWREKLALVDDEQRERRDRLSARVDKLAELVAVRTDRVEELLDARADEVSALILKRVGGLVALLQLNRQAVERVYALAEAEFPDDLGLLGDAPLDELYEEADAIGKKRIAAEERRRRARAQGAAKNGGDGRGDA